MSLPLEPLGLVDLAPLAFGLLVLVARRAVAR
jgi:hypothetical protein